MKIITKESTALTLQEIESIAHLAASGFNRANDEIMYSDTLTHIQKAETVTLARAENEFVGFSLLSRCLWR